MIEMRLRHLYNTTSERQDVRQDNGIFIRYSLINTIIHTVVINSHSNFLWNDTIIFLIQSKQAFHSVPEVKACSSLGGCNISPSELLFYVMRTRQEARKCNR